MSNVRRCRAGRVSPSGSSSISGAGADEQQREQSLWCRPCRTRVCMGTETARRHECRLRPRATCRPDAPNRRSLRRREIETHLQQWGCAQSTRETLRGTLAPPRARSELQSASQSAETSPNISPGLSGGASRTRVFPAFQQLSPPSRRNSGFVAALQAVNQRCSNCRALVRREAEYIFKQVVYASIHVSKSSSHGHQAPPNPSVERSAVGRPPGPGWRYAVHCRQPGPGVLPSSPG